MPRVNKSSLWRGVAAGFAGGLVAGYCMNKFSAGLGAKLSHELAPRNSPATTKASSNANRADATMLTAEKLSEVFDNGKHLTFKEQQKDGPVIHYAFAALAGGVYGALAEYVPAVTIGFGTVFASTLFVSADVIAVPALHLSAPVTDFPLRSYANPYASHLVYGIAIEAVRRSLRC